MILLLIAAGTAFGQSAAELPAGWQEAWAKPGPQYRPLQIVHGINLRGRQPEGVDQVVAGNPPSGPALSGMQVYRDHGLGGLVLERAEALAHR